MKKLLIVAALILAACTPKAETKHGYQAIMPPELKDCKVFTISDGTKELYVTRCGLETTTTWSSSCGKNCTRTDHSSVIDKPQQIIE